MKSLGRYGSLTRLAGAAVALGIGLVVLWQAGIVFKSDDASITDANGRIVDLQPADASLTTAVPAGRSVGLKPGEVAPDFEFSAFDGARMRLSDYRGRPVLVNFWATWCVPCRTEMPAMEVALRNHQADGLAILAVNNGDRLQAAQRFLEKLDIKLTAYAYDPASTIAERYAILGMPTSFFVDANGVITGVYASELSPKLIEQALQDAIAGYHTAPN